MELDLIDLVEMCILFTKVLQNVIMFFFISCFSPPLFFFCHRVVPFRINNFQGIRHEKSFLLENRGSSEFPYLRKIRLETKFNSHYAFCTAKTIQHCVKF